MKWLAKRVSLCTERVHIIKIMKEIPRIWTWAIIIKDNKFLVWKRQTKNSWYHKYCFPWWHIDFWESIIHCAIREAHEESGIECNKESAEVVWFTEDFYEGKHFITFFVRITQFTWEAYLSQKEEMSDWNWFSWKELNNMKDDIFLPMKNFMEKYPDFDPTK